MRQSSTCVCIILGLFDVYTFPYETEFDHGAKPAKQWHSLYGLTQERVTYDLVTDLYPSKRPFILGRSTYPSAGMVA
ncbi:hypothetical protein KIPB_015816, partial [Kipferlia bialata]|eukprot:g15816.t1